MLTMSAVCVHTHTPVFKWCVSVCVCSAVELRTSRASPVADDGSVAETVDIPVKVWSGEDGPLVTRWREHTHPHTHHTHTHTPC